MEDRIHKDELQSAIGNVLAEFDQVRDEFRRSQISRDAYLQQVRTLRLAGQRFQKEFKMAHRIMAAPTK
jgi:hypothetical protein